MVPAAALTLQLLLLLPGVDEQAAAQTTAPSQTPPQLPIDLNKIRIGVNAAPKLDLVDRNPFRFYTTTVAPFPKFKDIVGSFDLFNGPVPHSGMTHREFVQSTRPKDMYSSAGFTPSDVIKWGLLQLVEQKGFELLRKGIQELAEAKTEAERKQIRARIERELAALRGETIK
ncbi:MAG: hypothetical protein EPO35_03690 [Acidobacteria bacterium]|nr:MAG: hypothetical protein EPO35_03690 [Acidobacteriota bacterium]